MKGITLKKLATVFSILCLSQIVYAGNVNVATKATASLAGSCQVSSHNINFGTFSPASSGALYLNSSVDLLCSKNLTYNIVLSTAANSSEIDPSTGYGNNSTVGTTFIRTSNPLFTTSYPGGPARIMTGTISSDMLVFNLFSDSSYSTPFIDAYYLTKTGTGSLQSVPVYAKLPLQQYVTPDNYSQSVMVFIKY